jgi:hypothetical protein
MPEPGDNRSKMNKIKQVVKRGDNGSGGTSNASDSEDIDKDGSM